jgi:hypothetical protein
MARQQLTEAVGIAQPLNRIAGALGRPREDVSIEPPSSESLLSRFQLPVALRPAPEGRADGEAAAD